MIEGLVLALVLAFWLWGMLTLGGRTVTSETHSPMVQTAPTDIVVCATPDTSEKGAAPPAAGEGADCPPKVRPHTTTSRQPGAGLAGQEHRRDS